jgi:hypothetical protein
MDRARALCKRFFFLINIHDGTKSRPRARRLRSFSDGYALFMRFSRQKWLKMPMNTA